MADESQGLVELYTNIIIVLRMLGSETYLTQTQRTYKRRLTLDVALAIHASVAIISIVILLIDNISVQHPVKPPLVIWFAVVQNQVAGVSTVIGLFWQRRLDRHDIYREVEQLTLVSASEETRYSKTE